MKVSQSKIKLWRHCHAAYNYRYNKNLERRLRAHPLVLGTLVHECIEYWLQGKSHKRLFTKARNDLKPLFPEERLEYMDTIALAETMVAGYIDQHENDGLEPVEVELHIDVPLIEDITFTGKVDSIQRDIRNNRLHQVEHKTCASIPDEKSRMSDMQTLLYDWALQELGHPKISSVIWDYLRKKAPTVPNVLKNGSLSVAKNMDTTYEVYRQTILDEGLKVKDYKDFLAELKQRENTFYRRIKMPVSKGATASVVKDAQSSALQIRDLGETLTDRNLSRDCSWCDFYLLCQSDLRGGDTEFLIKKEYKQREKTDGTAKNANKTKAKVQSKTKRKAKAKKAKRKKVNTG